MIISYDLIIVAKSDNENLVQITKNCIESARKECDLNVVVVETGKGYPYDAEIIKYKGAFNYNRALNIGINGSEADILILANNDIIFHPGWSAIGFLMKEYGFDSASALSNDIRHKGLRNGNFVYPGYEIGRHITGWCIFLTREGYQKIGKLDESVKFWYSDDIYALQLKQAGLKHGLFTGIKIDHMTSQTYKTLNHSKQIEYSMGQKYIYVKRKRDIEDHTAILP